MIPLDSMNQHVGSARYLKVAYNINGCIIYWDYTDISVRLYIHVIVVEEILKGQREMGIQSFKYNKSSF